MDKAEGDFCNEVDMPLFKWFVMYCDDDDSHTLVPDEDVIYDRESFAPPSQGEEAFFFESGKKWRGVIKDMGDDYNILLKSRDRMNANKPKRNSSFHADQPRRAKLKCNEALGVRQTSIKSTSATSSHKTSIDSSQVERPVLKEKLSTLYARPSSSKDPETSAKSQRSDAKSSSKVQQPVIKERQSSISQSKGESKIIGQRGNKEKASTWDVDSSDDSLTEEELKVLAKLSEKKRRAEIKELAHLAVKVPSKKVNSQHNESDEGSPVRAKKSRLIFNRVSDSESEGDVPTGSKPVLKTANIGGNSGDKSKTSEETTTAEKPPKPKTAANIDTDDEGDSPDNDKPPSPIISNKRSKPRSNFVNPKLQFNGQFYLHKETDPNVVQLHEDHKVFVPEKVIKEVKRDASINTTTALTRYIVKKIFTTEALQQCSVFGRPSACKGREAMTCRPALDSEGVQAIIKFVLIRAEKKKWKGAMRSVVSAAMANVICEGRDLLKLTGK